LGTELQILDPFLQHLRATVYKSESKKNQNLLTIIHKGVE